MAELDGAKRAHTAGAPSLFAYSKLIVGTDRGSGRDRYQAPVTRIKE